MYWLSYANEGSFGKVRSFEEYLKVLCQVLDRILRFPWIEQFHESMILSFLRLNQFAFKVPFALHSQSIFSAIFLTQHFFALSELVVWCAKKEKCDKKLNRTDRPRFHAHPLSGEGQKI